MVNSVTATVQTIFEKKNSVVIIVNMKSLLISELLIKKEVLARR